MSNNLIELTEYQPVTFPSEQIPIEVGEILLHHYKNQLNVEFPTPKTGRQWQLTAQGWVGHLPVNPDYHFVLQPKVALGNLFRMLEYAYRLDVEVLDGLAGCRSLADFYERLANMLARRVLERGRKGFYRAYLPHTERLPYLRGRLEARQTLQRPGQIKLACHYQEHTADIADNQILAWTLFRIARSRLCSQRTLPTVRRAYRALQGMTTLAPHEAEACLNRSYHRLNQDYQPLHALCRFFLAQSGPSHTLGQQKIIPFLVNMESLYEMFIAEWLKQHLPAGLSLRIQAPAGNEVVKALIDLVLVDLDSGQTAYILDTKYKTPDKPANADIYQVVAYAEAKDCRQAVLIYPAPLAQPLDTMWGQIRVRSLTFSLAGDLEQAGQDFLRNLLER